jgi:hypothetical protein
MFVLALGDGAQWAMFLVNLAVSTVVGVLLFRITRDDRRKERTEDRYADELQKAKAAITAEAAKTHEANVKLVDERMRAFTHEANNAINGVVLNVNDLKMKVESTFQNLNELNTADLKGEMKVGNKIEVLKDYIRDNCASKQDFREHERRTTNQFDTLNKSLVEVGKEVAVLAARVEQVGSQGA